MPIELLLERLHAAATSSDTTALREIIDAIRPVNARDITGATENLRGLCALLRHHPEQAESLRLYLIRIIASRKIVHLCTDTGITLSRGFWSAAWQRLMFKLLPPLINDDYLADVFGQVFNRTDDTIWINGIDEKYWLELLHLLDLHLHAEHTGLLNELLSSVQVLSYRITAIGMEMELIRNYPEIERYESPLLRQNDEINDYIRAYHLSITDPASSRRDSRQIDILLTQCEAIAAKISRNAALQGISISLTRLLLRLTQSITRLRIILELIEAADQQQVLITALKLFKELVYFDNRKYSIGQLINNSTSLLTLQITEHAGRSGEHYVAENRREWFAMLRSAAGAGGIVGWMATIKILLSKLMLAPFGFAFLFSLNYSLGFMLVHILHFTIATKQPAMTAALIARSLDQHKQDLHDLCELIVQVIRTQLIAIGGNILLAIPTAYAIAWGWHSCFGQALVTPEKARHLLQDLDPLNSLALFHAAIAGVCLFLSGLISGYYDNKSSYNKIPERLWQLTAMQRLWGPARWQKITTYIGNNLGALAGNFFFGIMLGSIGQIGIFFGLPIDIRHITFSSANFAFALAGLNNELSWQTWVVSIVGIMLIGAINLTVSFSLALLVAMRSRNVSFQQTRALLALLWQRFVHHGRDFFWAPAK